MSSKADQNGSQRGIGHADYGCFNPTAKDETVATARRSRPAPKIELVRYVIDSAHLAKDVEQQDRALAAFTRLTEVKSVGSPVTPTPSEPPRSPKARASSGIAQSQNTS
ncbi:MAG: hypothetical protein AAF668_11975 [Pseudomonadota bacterium]